MNYFKVFRGKGLKNIMKLVKRIHHDYQHCETRVVCRYMYYKIRIISNRSTVLFPIVNRLTKLISSPFSKHV